LSGKIARGESENGASLDDAGFNSTNGHITDTIDLEHVLKGQT